MRLESRIFSVKYVFDGVSRFGLAVFSSFPLVLSVSDENNV